MSKTIKIARFKSPRNIYIIVDDDDYEHLKDKTFSIAFAHGKMKVVHRVNQRSINLTDYILPAKEGFIVDHIDRNTLNNQKNNLRYLTQPLNVQNRGMFSHNTSGYKGVSYTGYSYRTKYTSNGISYTKEGFKTAIEAAQYYDILVKQHSLLPDAPTNKSLGLL